MSELRPEGAVYKIDKVVGHGQTATVFRALREDSRGHSSQAVALKILNNKTSVPSLRREFEALARIDSPHCVRVLGWENLAEGCALVLEWIDGVNLLELGQSSAKGAGLADGIVDEILAQAFAGLRALQENGLFHGDISPRNILVDRQGCVKLIDFATVPNTESELIGTQAYLSPELWRGGTHSLEADLFALGILEHDLAGGFRSVPVNQNACRERAFAFSTQSVGLLSTEPRNRVIPSMRSKIAERTALAALVNKIVDARVLYLQTATCAQEPRAELSSPGRWQRRSPRRLAALLAMVAIGATAPVRAQAPGYAAENRASLELRTQNWVEIEINGKPVGYAPILVRGLKAGSHRLGWKTRLGKGEMQIELQAGEVLKLSEADLPNPSGGVKR
jgi:serine/threonine protein kinase